MNYVDRFLSVCPIRKSQLQLLGTTCLLLASKLREPKPLSADILVFYTDNSITRSDLWVSSNIFLLFLFSRHLNLLLVRRWHQLFKNWLSIFKRTITIHMFSCLCIVFKLVQHVFKWNFLKCKIYSNLQLQYLHFEKLNFFVQILIALTSWQLF